MDNKRFNFSSKADENVEYKIEEKYLMVADVSDKWNISERSVRNYCAEGRVIGAILDGKTWKIPFDAEKPERQIRHTNKKVPLLQALQREQDAQMPGGIYHKVQIELTYNSNHIEGSKLTHDQTQYIFETKTIGVQDSPVKIDDIVETVNHFRCVDVIIKSAKSKITESFIKQLHFILKTGTSDSQKPWFRVGAYKSVENEVGGEETAKPKEVSGKIKNLLSEYNSLRKATFDDILDFHVKFEKIHPFQDGNGRIGRLLMFKECLKNNIVPFIITDELKFFYYRGIKNWSDERGYLRDTCLSAQDEIKKWLNYFEVKHE